MPLTENRLKSLKSELKEQFSDIDELNLRIELEKENSKTGETEIEIETLLSNLLPEIMRKDDISEIYDARWRIECTYKTLKQKAPNRKLHHILKNRDTTRHILHIPNIQHILLLQNILKHDNQQSNEKKRKNRILRRGSIQLNQQH